MPVHLPGRRSINFRNGSRIKSLNPQRIRISAPELITVWKDPDFDPTQRAFYYVRVIEIPTPRWTAYDPKRFGTKPLPGTAMTLQERTYTSPIWYTP